MRALNRFGRRIRALFFGATLDRELSDEVRLHLELEANDLVRTRGLAPAEARRQARIAFGGFAVAEEAHRDARGVRWFEDSLRDVRYAFRVLARSPGYAISAALILALAIGATTAVFSGIHTVLLSSLPYAHDEQLVRVFNQSSPTNRWGLSTVDFQALQAQGRTISAIGGFRLSSTPVSAGGDPRSITIASATSGFFKVLELSPTVGRAIESRDEPVGAPLVAVVTNRYATEAFGSAASAVGKTLTIDGKAHVVIGVFPEGVTRFAGFRVPVWTALQLPAPQRRGPFGMFVYARLNDGTTLDAARRDFIGISERIFPIWEAGFQDKTSKLTPIPLRQVILRDAPQTLGLFAAAAGLVLLIAVANVASLTLVRATVRAPELSLRSVLGATRARLVRLVVIESVVLALLGAVGGIVLGVVGLDLLVRLGPSVPRLDEARLDPQAVLFAIAVAITAGIVVGAYPILMLMRGSSAGLRDGARAVGGGRGAQAVRGAFVVAEFALALPLLAGAGLLLNGFLRLSSVEPGFDPERIVSMRVSLPAATYPTDSAMQTFWTRALPALGQVPGVASAGFADALPPNDDGMNVDNFDLIDAPVPSGKSQPVAPELVISHDYFQTFALKLLDGRSFGPGDSATAPPVMVVSQAWAHRYFPDRSAVGRQLILGGCVSCPHITVIGVVSDVPYQGLDGTRSAMYVPREQGVPRVVNLFVRAEPGAEPRAVLASARTVMRSVDPGVALDAPSMMRDVVYESVAQPRHLVTLLGGFAVAAVALAAVGIFGLLSFTVRMRTKEIGVRMALGAQRREVVAEIIARGMRFALIGAAIGMVVALIGARALAKVLYGVSATDPLTLGLVTAGLLLVALVASWLPARRAASIDPVGALREG